MKNLFLIIGLSFLIPFEGFSQGIPGPVAGSASLQINGVQIKRNDKYTHPIANQNIVLSSTLSIYPGVFDNLNLIGAYVYKNGNLIKNISGQSSGINYSFAPVSYANSFPVSMYLTLVIPCDDPSYGPGNYWVNFQYQYISTYDYNHYSDNIVTITGTVDPIPTNAYLCGNYIGTTILAANTITGCSNITLQSGSHTTLVASQKIIFSPGFKAISGSSMHALINNGCISSNVLARTTTNTEVLDYPTDYTSSTTSVISKKAYPNPTNGILNIPIINHSKEYVFISLYNSLGEIIYSKNIAPSSNTFDIVNINLNSYSTGIYILKVTSDNNTSIQQIILEK